MEITLSIGLIFMGLVAIIILGLSIRKAALKKRKNYHEAQTHKICNSEDVVSIEIPFLETVLVVAEEQIGHRLTEKECKIIERTLRKIRTESASKNLEFPDPFITRYERRRLIGDLMEYLHLLHGFYIERPYGLHEFVKLHDSITKAYTSVSGILSSSDDFKIALRICSIAHHQNVCNYSLDENELIEALKWSYGGVRDEKVLKYAIDNYEQYWDGVLEAYVRPSARIKRLNYLVKKLEEFSQEPCILQLPDLLPQIHCLQQKYMTMLP